MDSRKSFLFVIFIFTTLLSLILFITYNFISKKQDNLLKSIYQTTYKNIYEKTENLISDKQNTSLAIAISLSKDENLYNHLKNKEFDKLNYEKIAKLIENYSKYKNIWIQILDKNKNSLYRSWTNIRDGVQFREDLENQAALKNISTSISIGLFNIGIKARTPILDEENNFYGALEVITHFDSITEDLQKNGISSIIIADKKFRKNLKYPLLSNIFIDDYYIANENANTKLCNYIEENGIEKYINIETYIIENDYLIANYNLFNEKKEKIGQILNFYDLKNIDSNYISSIKKQTILTILIILITLFFIFILYLYTRYTNKIKSQKQKNRLILDSQSSIVIITNGNEIIDSNKKLIEFFKDCKNLNDFKKKYKCICSSFVDINSENYLLDIDYNGKNWAEYALDNQNIDFKVAIYDIEKNLKHFSLKVSKLKNDNLIIVTFTDISQDIVEAEKEKNEQRIIFQQAKLNAITNTLNNIAHQWRQPLSVISTLTSGMKLKKELNLLSDKEFNKSCDTIIFNTTKLSNTIENFTNFFTNEKENKLSVVESINQIIEFLDSIFERNQIICHFKHSNDILLECDSSSFSEAILNIFDNSISALIENKNINERYILVELEDKILTIIDSGNGINEEIITKVCEPYFTTKHQAFGIGLGLYLVEEFFAKTLNTKIELKNEDFIYENKNLKGLKFTIYFD
ncbi:Cache sensor-containing signal transduction histidine kinase [Aliarcobacter faecis]|uniref:sensor histidine kinase n=1 Tax=Aliarcobacter faecis TaxID=1564138 RepID=UPI00047CB2B8|nr:ATP-binding protein [Aliarcobacter faecis]QKF73712.1 Cache sensor-containing signal transduction histidine kinase [Aliarcobacter faecis]